VEWKFVECGLCVWRDNYLGKLLGGCVWFTGFLNFLRELSWGVSNKIRFDKWGGISDCLLNNEPTIVDNWLQKKKWKKSLEAIFDQNINEMDKKVKRTKSAIMPQSITNSILNMVQFTLFILL
jgi:hypothetical protein